MVNKPGIDPIPEHHKPGIDPIPGHNEPGIGYPIPKGCKLSPE